MTKWKYGSIGTVSQATMLTEDLIPSFVAELRELGHRSRELTKIEKRIARVSEDDPYWQDEIAQWDLDTLFDMLDEHSPAYMYFGAHPGNGSDYGFWLSESIYEGEFDGLTVNDLSEVPEKHSGEVLHVNDHGNLTLYACKRGKLTEVWSVV